jgi:lipoprotein-anchoring transpeptidase ErfK/SrfK
VRLYTKYMPLRRYRSSLWFGSGIVLLSLVLIYVAWFFLRNPALPSGKSSKPTQFVLTTNKLSESPPAQVVVRPAPVIPIRGSQISSSNGWSEAQSNSAVTTGSLLPLATNLATLQPTSDFLQAQTVFEAQLALARQNISCGSLDGVLGAQTRSALRAFQVREKLPGTGTLDEATRGRLRLMPPVYTNYVLTSNDLARLSDLPTTWLGKSEQVRLDYETVLELVAEKSQAHPSLIRRLNPQINWMDVRAGTLLVLPWVPIAPVGGKAAWVRIELAEKTLEAFDAETNLLVHFPCSVAARVEKRPVGRLKVVAVALNPVYVFRPEVFPESAEAQSLGRNLVLPAGPNNPVGLAWISLNRSGYGIHGTPRPEEVGRTESHGCFRLANWNAELLAHLVGPGTPVLVEP